MDDPLVIELRPGEQRTVIFSALPAVPGPDPDPDPEPEPEPEPTPTGHLWISPQRLASLPTSGAAWTRLTAKAKGNWGSPSFSSYTEDWAHGLMAGALVAARIDAIDLRSKVITNITTAMSKPYGRDSFKEVTRILPEIVMSASLVGYRSPGFTDWLRELLAYTFGGSDPGTIATNQRTGPGNSGAMAGASLAAIGVYLADPALIAQAVDGLRMFLGQHPGDFEIREQSRCQWYAAYPDRTKYVPINPTPSTRSGMDVSGLLPVEMDRGESNPPDPVYKNYPRVTLNGRVVQAGILREAGAYDAFADPDKGLVRASEALFRLGGRWAEPEMNQNWLLNHYANAGLGFKEPSAGRCCWGVDWSHA